MHITRYAVKDVDTGEYLPTPQGRLGRGGSHLEPCLPVDGDIATHPRLFLSEIGARNALSQWRRGKHRANFYYDEDCLGRLVKMGDSPHIEKIPERLARKMKVVPILIHF